MTDSWFATNLYSKMHKLTYPWRPWIGQTWTFIISESFQISFTFFRLAVLKRIFKFMITPHLLPFLIIIPWQRRFFIWKKTWIPFIPGSLCQVKLKLKQWFEEEEKSEKFMMITTDNGRISIRKAYLSYGSGELKRNTFCNQHSPKMCSNWIYTTRGCLHIILTPCLCGP